MVRDSLVRDEPAGDGVAMARVPQLGVGALRGIDGHTGGYYLYYSLRSFLLYILGLSEVNLIQL